MVAVMGLLVLPIVKSKLRVTGENYMMHLQKAIIYNGVGLCGNAVALSVPMLLQACFSQRCTTRKSNKLMHLSSKWGAASHYFVFHCYMIWGEETFAHICLGKLNTILICCRNSDGFHICKRTNKQHKDRPPKWSIDAERQSWQGAFRLNSKVIECPVTVSEHCLHAQGFYRARGYSMYNLATTG